MASDAIFIVDDDEDLRESIVEILADSGFTVIACSTAESALQKMKIEPPRLIIVDNMMPGMGGMTFIPLAKKELPSVKIIMITAFSTVDNAVLAMKTGADDYLAKPFKRDELIVSVRRNLETLKFAQKELDPDVDEALASLSNPIRRQILTSLFDKPGMRFMDIARQLGIRDHTKINFHLKNLRINRLVQQDRQKLYLLTPQGEKMVDCLKLISQKISS
jgi:DNA-binding response OmpR family regulator